jgi:hypothetical protein
MVEFDSLQISSIRVEISDTHFRLVPLIDMITCVSLYYAFFHTISIAIYLSFMGFIDSCFFLPPGY